MAKLKPIVFWLTASAVLAGTIGWTKHLLVKSEHDIYRLTAFSHIFARFDRPSVPWVAGSLAAALLLAWRMPRRWLEAPANWIGSHPIATATLAFVALSACARFVYDAYPLALDEYAQYFQAQIFAAGHLHGQYPKEIVDRLLPLPGEYIAYSKTTGETMSTYLPGLPLLMAPFMWLGIPWMLNPLLGALGLLLIRHLALKLMPETPEAAGWAMLFMLASPSFSVNAISFYAMNVYLVSGLAYVALLFEPTPIRLFAAGLLGSLAMLQHNPVPHALFAAPWIVWMAIRPGRIRRLFFLGLGYLPAPAVAYVWLAMQKKLVSTAAVSAAATVTDYSAANSAWKLPTEFLLDERLVATMKLYLWAVPGLLVIGFFGYRRLRGRVEARLLAWSAVVVYVTYLFVRFDQGHGWGYRYFQPAWGVLPLFGAAWVTERAEGRRWAPLMGGLAIISLVVLTPLRMSNVHELIREAQSMVPTLDPSKDEICFLDTKFGRGRYYAQDEVRNDPFLRSRHVILRSIDAAWDEKLARGKSPGARLVSRTVHGTVWDLSPDVPSP